LQIDEGGRHLFIASDDEECWSMSAGPGSVMRGRFLRSARENRAVAAHLLLGKEVAGEGPAYME
jgi:hypothetical protein